MRFQERFSSLQAYPFDRLRSLLAGQRPGGEVVDLSLGEPKHPFPAWIGEVITRNLAEFGRYPDNAGEIDLRQAIAEWVARRYGVDLDPDRRILVLNGTREGLFNACLALCPDTKNGQRPCVVIPNPFYQVYAGAACAAGAEPVYANADESNGFLPDYWSLSHELLRRTSICYLCSPSNPQGAVASMSYLVSLLKLAERHDFVVFADECYSEIYRSDRPPGAMEAAMESHADPERLLIFHSLSKRSNLPGLRAGFVAGGPAAIAAMKRLRSYGGAPCPTPLQRAAARIWRDEDHVRENRRKYRRKFETADTLFDGVPEYRSPDAGFFLWLKVEDGEEASLRLWRQRGVKVLPGRYFGCEVNGVNPGHDRIRVALVAPQAELATGLKLIKENLYR